MLEQIQDGSGPWFYSVTVRPGHAKPDDPGEPARVGPFDSDMAALEAARIHLIRDKQAY